MVNIDSSSLAAGQGYDLDNLEYTAPPRQPAPRLAPETWIDPSWLRGTRFPKPSAKFKDEKKKKKKRKS